MRRWCGHIRRLWTDEGGGSLAEFAILLPVFLPLLFGTVQLGQLFWTQTALQHAVEMAARCATINASSCSTATATQTYAATQAYGLTFPTGTFTASAPSCGNQVAASYTFPFITGWFPATVTLTAQSCYPL
jgi:Flp pilus assembly protein TadG